VVVAFRLELIEFLVEVFSLSSRRRIGAVRRAHLLSKWEWGKRRGEDVVLKAPVNFCWRLIVMYLDSAEVLMPRGVEGGVFLT
jgi:hypothetical protein